METQESYSIYIDEERLKEAFFSPKAILKTHENASAKFSKKPSLQGLIIAAILLLTAVLSINYDLIIMPRKGITAKEQKLSLISDKSLAQISTAGKKGDVKVNNSAIYLNSYSEKDSGLKIDFSLPQDLRNKSLFLTLKNPSVSVKIIAIIKDRRYFSNALKPLITITEIKDPREDIEVEFNFNDASLINTNINSIQQVRLYFYPLIKEEEMGLLIKDLVLIDKSLKLGVENNEDNSNS